MQSEAPQSNIPGNPSSEGSSSIQSGRHRLDPEEEALADDLAAQSTLELVRRLIDELSVLFHQEVMLARTELRELLQDALKGVANLAGGAALLFVAALTLVTSGVLALATVMPPWLAALIMSIVIGVVGYGVLRGGRRKLDPAALKPHRTSESLRLDAAVLARKRR